MPNSATALVREPRGMVQIRGSLQEGGERFDYWVSMTVLNNTLNAADTFSVVFPVAGLPADKDANWFSQQKDMYVELFLGFPADPVYYTSADLTSFILGQVDAIDFDPIRGQISLSGRDLTRVFIDAKTSEKFQAKTSSQIVQLLAARRGLTANVTATTVPAGKYYDIDHVNLEDERSEWDIIMYLAQCENFIAYVKGQTLYFGPKPDASKSQVTYPIVWTPPTNGGSPTANIEQLEFSRHLTVSRGLTVVVRSWNESHAHGFNSIFPRKSSASIAAGQSTTPKGQGQVYYVRKGNLTQQQADQLAQATYAQIIAHEMKMAAHLPGDITLDPRSSVITVTGTSTQYDQTYYPESVERTLSMHAGFAMHVHAKNANPASEAVAL